MRVMVAMAILATAFFTSPAYADDTDGGLRFQPGFQLNVFGTTGGPLDDSGHEGVAWAFGGQGTLFKWKQLSFGGGGLSFIRLRQGHTFAPYLELVTIDMSRGPGIIGITFKYVFRNAFSKEMPGEPLDHGLGIGFVFTGF